MKKRIYFFSVPAVFPIFYLIVDTFKFSLEYGRFVYSIGYDEMYYVVNFTRIIFFIGALISMPKNIKS